MRASLVVQWLGVRLPMQGTRANVSEDAEKLDLSHTHTHTHTHTHSHTHTHTHTHTHSLTHSHTHLHTLSHTLTHTHSHTHGWWEHKMAQPLGKSLVVS